MADRGALGSAGWDWGLRAGLKRISFRQQVGVFAQAITRAFDLNDDGVVEGAIEEGSGDDGIGEDVAPFGEAAVRGEDHRPLFISGVDELEE